MGYSIAWAQRDCSIRYTGTVTFSDLLSAVMRVHVDPNFSGLKRLVHDMSGASDLDFHDLDIHTLASHVLGARFTNPLFETAIISDRNEVAQFAQHFQDLTRLEVKVFAETGALEEWITQAAPLWSSSH